MICLNLCERARRRRTYLFRTYRFHASASEAHANTAVESTDPSQSKNCFAPRTAGVWVLAKRWHDFASKEFHRFFDFFMRDAAKIEGCGQDIEIIVAHRVVSNLDALVGIAVKVAAG